MRHRVRMTQVIDCRTIAREVEQSLRRCGLDVCIHYRIAAWLYLPVIDSDHVNHLDDMHPDA